MPKIRPATVNDYIDSAPAEARPKLQEIRAILHEAAPGAKEAIKWGYPVFEDNRILFSFSAHKTHLNFMPTGPALEPFKGELASFNIGKDTIQFPYNKPLPKALIKKIAEYRVKDVKENGAKWMY